MEKTPDKKWIPEKYPSICNHCEKFVDFSIYETKEVEKLVLVYRSPKGDQDNDYADITYNVSYIVCPNCKHEREIKRSFCSQDNKRKLL